MFSRSLMIFSSPPSSYISQFVCVLRFLWEQSEPSERHSWSLEAETESSSAVCRRGRSSTHSRDNVCVLLNKHTPVWVHLSVCHLCSKLQAHSHEHVQVKHAGTVSCRVSLVVTRSMLRIITLVFANQSQFTKCLMATEQHTLWTVVPERLSPSRLLVCLSLTMLRFTKPSSFSQNSSWKHGFSATQGIKPLTSASINVFKEELNSFSVTVMFPGFVSSLSSSLGCDVSS